MGKTVARNKKARYDYFIEDTLEAGLVLTGTEVKSVRAGKVSIKESYAEVKKGEVFVKSMHISPYEQGNINNVDSLRVRKLLLNKREILKIERLLKQESITLVPLSVYINNKGLMKMELAICKGKKKYDKRDVISERDNKLHLKREIKNRNYRD